MTVTKYKTKSGIRYKAVFKNDLQVFKRHGFTSSKEAKVWEAGERARINAGGMRSNQTLTVAEYLEWWHGSFVWRTKEQKFSRNAKKRKMGRSNYIRNRQHINKISSVIGHIKVCKLTPELVYKREEQFLKSELNPEGLAPSTIRKMQFMLKGALEDGVKEKQLASNPLSGMDALNAYRVWQSEIFLKAGRSITDQTHVFFNDGTFGILHKSVSQHRWEKLLKTAGLEHRSMHKNRHTFSSRAIRGGIRPELLTEVMGHSEKRTTMEIYGHQFEEAFEENMKVIDAIEAGLVQR